MKNEIEICKKESDLPIEPKNNNLTFNQSGSGTNIGVAQKVTSTINIMLPISNISANEKSTYINKKIKLDFFNLFVILGEQFDKGYFIVDVNRALRINEGTSKIIHDRLASFTSEAKSEIMSFPCIFTDERGRYTSEDTTQRNKIAKYGFITNIQQLHDGNLKIYFQILPFCEISQDLLYEMCDELDICGRHFLNEFDKTHWAIKNVNVVEELKKKGISLLIPS